MYGPHSNNITTVTGHVGNKPNYYGPKNDNKNSAVLFFDVAVEPQPGLKNADGTYADQTPYWIPCQMFGPLATAVQEAIKKGDRIQVLGGLRSMPEAIVLPDGRTVNRPKITLAVQSFEILRRAGSKPATTETVDELLDEIAA